MRRKVRAIGWGLLALAVAALAVIVTVGGLRAHGATAFTRWVGLATIAAVPIATVGVLLVLWDKITGPSATRPRGDNGTEDELAAVVLAQTQVARSRLIGAGEPDDQAANVRFIKGSGRFREVGGAATGNLASVLEYYQSLSPGRLVVLGEPGAGKTVLVMELQIRLLEARQHDTNEPIPVLISAAAYDTSREWVDWLAEHLDLRFSIGSDAAAQLVRDGRILPIVDGLDEMDPARQPKRALSLVAALNASMRGTERAPIVVTCRPGEYQALPRSVDRATHIEMLPLTSDEAAGYLRDQFLDQDEEQRWGPVLATLDADPDGPLAAQLATPWRLTLALTAFRDTGDPSKLLPAPGSLAARSAEAYRQQMDGLLFGRYVSAAVRLHDPAGRYTEQQVQRWMTDLADGLARQSRRGGSATDIQLHRWWGSAGRVAAPLTHVAVAAVPGLACLAISVVTGVRGLALVGVVCLGFASTAGKAPAPNRLSIRQRGTRRRLGLSVANVTLGILYGLGFAAIVGVIVGRAFGLVPGVATGLGAWPAFGVGVGFDDASPQPVGPRDIVRADGAYGLAVGLAVALATGLASGLTIRLPAKLLDGLVIGVALGLTFGLTTLAEVWTRFHISVVIAAIRGHGPLGFGAFLDWAQQAGLLRVSGIAYQFRHRQLQDWLTSP